MTQAGNPQRLGAEGTVRDPNAFGASGYLADPEETSRAFQDGWFYPGDTGRLTAEGLLVIGGRTRTDLDPVATNSEPEMVEEMLVAHPSVEQSAVFSMPNEMGVDELWAVVVARGAFDQRALRTHCESHLPENFIPARFLVVSGIPLNAMGKVERSKLPEPARIQDEPSAAPGRSLPAPDKSAVDRCSHGHSIDPFLFHARTSPDAPAVCAPALNRAAVTSWTALLRLTNNVANMAGSLGLKRGNVVGIKVVDRLFHIGVMLGLTRRGITTVSLRDNSLPGVLNAAAVICDQPQQIKNVARVIEADRTWFMGNGAPPQDNSSRHVAPDDLCRIVLTSGSTGEPRGVRISHRHLVEKIARNDYTNGNRWPGSARLYCDMGLSSSPAFRFVMYSLSRGSMILLYGEDAVSTVQALNLFRIDHMMTSPHGLGEHIEDLRAGRQPAVELRSYPRGRGTADERAGRTRERGDKSASHQHVRRNRGRLGSSGRDHDARTSRGRGLCPARRRG